jgi:hypothetical protein
MNHDGENSATDRSTAKSADEPEQHGSSVRQSRVDDVNKATSSRLKLALGKHDDGKDLTAILPDITAFRFSRQLIEDFYPIRLRIGVAYHEKHSSLYYLWIYLKRVEPSPHTEYVINSAVSARGAKVKKRTSITHTQLRKMLNEETAELYPLFSPFGAQKHELQALARYGYILAAESTDIFMNFSDHKISINPYFETHLEKVCRQLRSEPVDFSSCRFSLPLKYEDRHIRNLTNTGVVAALDANYTEHTDSDQLVLQALEVTPGPSNDLPVGTMQHSSGSSSSENNTQDEDSNYSITPPARLSQARRHRVSLPEEGDLEGDLEDDTPRRSGRLQTARDRTPPAPDSENDGTERGNSGTPVPEPSPA